MNDAMLAKGVTLMIYTWMETKTCHVNDLPIWTSRYWGNVEMLARVTGMDRYALNEVVITAITEGVEADVMDATYLLSVDIEVLDKRVEDARSTIVSEIVKWRDGIQVWDTSFGGLFFS